MEQVQEMIHFYQRQKEELAFLLESPVDDYTMNSLLEDRFSQKFQLELEDFFFSAQQLVLDDETKQMVDLARSYHSLDKSGINLSF